MNRREFLAAAGGAAALTAAGIVGTDGGAVMMASSGEPDTRSYESATISIRLWEEGGRTALALTEHGDADYAIVQAFYWTTEKINGKDVRLLRSKDTTTPLAKGVNMGADLPMRLASIVFLRVRELKLMKESEFGERPR